MRPLDRRLHATTALVTAAVLCAAPAAPLLDAQTPSTPQAAAAAAAQDVDGGWPRDYDTAAGGALRVFQPQVASWDGQKHIVMYAAASFAAKGATKAELGTVKMEADTSVAVSERLVNFNGLKLTESNFPGLSRELLQEVTSTIDAAVPDGALVMALDRVLARLDKSQIIPKNVEGVKAEPPVIFYSTTTAALVNMDGEPIWSPIKDNDLRFVVNTNWDLFEHGISKALYLRYNNSWLTAADIKGPWKPTTQLPDSFSKLPADDNWKEVKAAIPARSLSGNAVPKIFVSTTPAELILLRGAPSYLTVPSTTLLWINNTESDLFRTSKTGTVYFLVSGRWFSAPDFAGPWTFASQQLPEGFKNIPVSHERSRVLASVPGTDQAAEAVLLAQIPQTAAVSKKGVTAPPVDYDGTPKFDPIPATKVARASNTDKDVIKVGDMYYMCFQGVWFMGRSPNGPWEVTGSVPGEMYEIPVSSPAYPVTQVTVIEDDDDEVVYATAAAYTGMMVAWGCVVWGSGYYYPPYIGYGGYYPMYYPYYPTYGFHASYNPWTGAYSRGMTAYGPYGGAGVGARYNPRTGTYARGAAAWGPGGARGYASAYNPRTGMAATTRQGSNIYSSWGQTGVRRGDDWASTSRVTNNRTGTTTRVTQGSGGGEAISRRGGAGGNTTIGQTGSGDVYAGHDGNVYRKQGDGSWQQWNGGGSGWGDAATPTPQTNRTGDRTGSGTGSATTRPADSATRGQLEKDSAARTEGATRTKDYSSPAVRSGNSGSYRPSGGMRSGGGGRRR